MRRTLADIPRNLSAIVQSALDRFVSPHEGLPPDVVLININNDTIESHFNYFKPGNGRLLKIVRNIRNFIKGGHIIPLDENRSASIDITDILTVEVSLSPDKNKHGLTREEARALKPELLAFFKDLITLVHINRKRNVILRQGAFVGRMGQQGAKPRVLYVAINTSKTASADQPPGSSHAKTIIVKPIQWREAADKEAFLNSLFKFGIQDPSINKIRDVLSNVEVGMTSFEVSDLLRKNDPARYSLEGSLHVSLGWWKIKLLKGYDPSDVTEVARWRLRSMNASPSGRQPFPRQRRFRRNAGLSRRSN